MKKIIIPSLIILLLMISTFFINKKGLEVEKNNQNNQISKILSSKLKYADLNVYEKTLVDKIDITLDTQSLKDSYGQNYKDYISLRYYDNTIAIFCIPTGKLGCYIEFYDLKNQSKLSPTNIVIAGNEVVSENYLIVINSNEIFYFKPGMKDFQTVINSNISGTDTTYVKQGGMLEYFEVYFTESTKTLTASVFKNENKGDRPNTKLREVEFSLL